eukprot:sb/3471274/
MNFEPCNPPLLDPFVLELLVKNVVKPQSPIVLEPSTKCLPLRPIPIKLTSPERHANDTPNITLSRRSPPQQLIRSPRSSFSPRRAVRSSPYHTKPAQLPGKHHQMQVSQPEPQEEAAAGIWKPEKRHNFTTDQVKKLREWFTRYTYLTLEARRMVAKETGLPEKTVMYWFQNQRRRVKRSSVTPVIF